MAKITEPSILPTAIPETVFPPIVAMARRPVVSAATCMPRATLYRNIKNGLFTRPVKIGSGARVAWPISEINAINAARIAGKTEAEIKALVADLEKARAQA